MFLSTGNKSNCVVVIKTWLRWNLYFSTKKSLPCGAFVYTSSKVRVKRGILTLYLSSLNMLRPHEYSYGWRVIYYVNQPHPIRPLVTSLTPRSRGYWQNSDATSNRWMMTYYNYNTLRVEWNVVTSNFKWCLLRVLIHIWLYNKLLIMFTILMNN